MTMKSLKPLIPPQQHLRIAESRKTQRITSPERKNRFSALDEDFLPQPSEDPEMMDVESNENPTDTIPTEKTRISKRPSPPNWFDESDEDEPSSSSHDPTRKPLLTQDAAHDQAQYSNKADHGSAPT